MRLVLKILDDWVDLALTKVYFGIITLGAEGLLSKAKTNYYLLIFAYCMFDSIDF